MGTKIIQPPKPSSTVEEINRLHSEIVSAAKTSVEKAIRIGELLTDQKASLKHGEWLPWLKSNAPFSERTAQNYLRCFEHRADLKSATVADLAEAYRLLMDTTKPVRESLTSDERELLKTLESEMAECLLKLDEARRALLAIRDEKLYCGKFNTFEEYVAAKLGKNCAEFLLEAVITL